MAPKPKPARFVFTVGMALADGVDHPNDGGGRGFGGAELVSGLPSSTFAVVLRGPQAARGLNVEPPWLTRMIAPEDSSAPSAALLPSSERYRFMINRVSAPTRRASAPARRGRDLPRRGRRRPDPSRGRDAQIGVQKMTVAPIDIKPEASSPPQPESTRGQAILCAVRVTR